MKFFLAQLRRDLGDWWLLFGAAILAGLFPLLLPIVYATEGEESVELRVATAIAGTLLYGLATLAMLGDGLAARDIAEGRFGFYLARPMPTSILWAARVTAALLLFVLVVAALALPTWWATSAQDPAAGSRTPLASMVGRVAVTAPGVTLDRIFEPTGHDAFFGVVGVLGAVGLVLSLLLLAHGASTSGRSRSLWTLLDLVGLAVVVMVWLSLHDTLVSAGAFGALVVAERLFLVALATVLWFAGYRQLRHGRSDLGRGHGFFSRTLWPLLAVVILCLVGWARWTAAPEAEDLVSVEHLWASGNGRMLSVGGQVAHRFGLRTAVLYPTTAGDAADAEALGPVAALATARHADVAAWIRCRRWTRADCAVWTWRLDNGAAPAETGIRIDRWDPEIAVSPYGQLVAVATDRLEIWQPDVPKLVLARDLPGHRAHRPTFLSSDTLRFLHVDYDGPSTTLEQIDLGTGAARVLVELPGDALQQHVHMSESGRLVTLGAVLPPRLFLVDTERGEVRDLRRPDDDGNVPLSDSEALLDARFVGEDLVLLSRSTAGRTGLLRISVRHGLAGGLQLEVEELPLPATLTGLGGTSRIAPYEGGVLLSGATDDPAPGAAALPADVGSLPGLATFYLDLSADVPRWSRVAAGVVLPGWGRLRPGDAMEMERDAAFLLAGGGAVLRLADGELSLVVPALPDTDVGSLVAYGLPED